LALKYKYFWQTDVAQIKVQNPSDKIKAIIRVDPYTNRHLNITVKTQRENVTMYDIPLPFYIRPLNVKRSTMKQYYENGLFGKDAPICEINENRVKTFDEAEFGFRLGTCWTVLAKDCSNERSFAVLAKRTGESEEKAVKIITPYGKVKLMKKPNHNSIMLEKDGETVTMRRDEPIEIVQHGHVIISVKLEDDMNCRVYLPEQQVKVYFDGFNVNVKMQTPLYMGRQCGICGNMDFDSNPETEFYRVDSDMDYYETEYDVRKAFHTYTIKDDQCSRPEKYEEMCEDENCAYDRTAFPDTFRTIRDPFDLPGQYDYRSEITPVRKTRKIERHGKLCFSTRLIPTCPSHTYPSGIKKTEEVTFKCQPKYSTFWGKYDTSSESSSSTEEQELASGEPKLQSESSSDLSTETSSSESSTPMTTRHRGNRLSSSERRSRKNVESSSGSDSTSSSSSSERFFDSAESNINDSDMETIKMTVTIPETCRKL
jgi:anti-sigma28 factor (negative regulator of flagellin synthesis)